LTGALVQTGPGAGLGWLYGRYLHPLVNPDVDPDAAGRTSALIGGSIAGAARLPFLINYAATHGLRNINSGPEVLAKRGTSLLEPPWGTYDDVLTPQERSSVYDAFPSIRSTARRLVSGTADHGFSAGHSRESILSDPHIGPAARRTMADAMRGVRRTGSITGADVARGLVGAGVGYVGAGVLGSTLGGLFGMSGTTRRRLRAGGAIAGALYGTGVLRR
jgi:hypothetical protein